MIAIETCRHGLEAISDKPKFLYNRKTKKYVLDKVIVADTETSHIGEELCWIYETGIYDGSEFYIGRKPTDFMKHLRQLKEKYRLNERKYAVIYVHNLSYDISYLLPWIISIYRDTEVFALTKRKILTVHFGCFELRCSYLLSNMSLELWGKKLNTPHKKKKGLIDYDTIRYPDSELTDDDIEYFKYDLLTLYDCLTAQLKLYDDDINRIPLTSTGYERRKCRKVCANESYKRWFKKTALTPNTYRLCRSAFAGGYVHANRFLVNKTVVSEHKKPIKHRDMKSFYPSVQMLCYFPITKFVITINKPTNIEKLYRYIENECCLMTVAIENPRIKEGVTAPYLQHSHCFNGRRYRLDNGRVLAVQGDVLYTCTELDIEIVMSQYDYDSLYVMEMYTAQRGDFPDEIKSVVLDAFRYKESLSKSSELYGKSKNLLNGIYGMTATDIVRNVFELQKDRTISESVGNIGVELDKYYNGIGNFMPYQLGVWTTAHCRNILIKLITEIGYENFIYCDTDSIFYFEDEKSINVVNNFNNEIIATNEKKGYKVMNRDGEYSYFMTFEDENDDIQKFRTLHSKCYVMENGKGELNCIIAGVTKDNKQPKDSDKYVSVQMELESIENLENNFTFIECGGTKSKYLHVDPQEVNINGHMVEIGDGCIITRTTKTLSTLKTNDIKEIYERS